MAKAKKTAPKKAAKKAPAKKAAPKKATPKAAPKKAAPDGKIKAYSIGERKHVPMLNPQIAKRGNAYVARGTDAKGRNMTAFIGREQANAALKTGAKKLGRW